MFIHDAILETVTCGDTQVNAANLRVTLIKMEVKNQHTQRTNLQDQFEVCNTFMISCCYMCVIIDKYKLSYILKGA